MFQFFMQIQDDCLKCSELDKIDFPYWLRVKNLFESKFLVHRGLCIPFENIKNIVCGT
jgi:hypothetical protein